MPKLVNQIDPPAGTHGNIAGSNGCLNKRETDEHGNCNSIADSLFECRVFILISPHPTQRLSFPWLRDAEAYRSLDGFFPMAHSRQRAKIIRRGFLLLTKFECPFTGLPASPTPAIRIRPRPRRPRARAARHLGALWAASEARS